MTMPKCDTCGEDSIGILRGPDGRSPRIERPVCARCGWYAANVLQRIFDEEDDEAMEDT